MGGWVGGGGQQRACAVSSADLYLRREGVRRGVLVRASECVLECEINLLRDSG